MAYRLSRRAAADLLRIYVEGGELFGNAQADRYHARLERLFRLLAENPRMARERFELSPPLCAHPCGSHVILYTIEPGGILIVRVRHGREDWTSTP